MAKTIVTEDFQPLKKFLLKYNIQKRTQILSELLDEFSQTEYIRGSSTQIDLEGGTIPIFQGCKQDCSLLQRETRSLSSKIVRHTNSLENVDQNKDRQCLCS